jgi:hypothetical protein
MIRMKNVMEDEVGKFEDGRERKRVRKCWKNRLINIGIGRVRAEIGL